MNIGDVSMPCAAGRLEERPIPVYLKLRLKVGRESALEFNNFASGVLTEEMARKAAPPQGL